MMRFIEHSGLKRTPFELHHGRKQRSESNFVEDWTFLSSDCSELYVLYGPRFPHQVSHAKIWQIFIRRMIPKQRTNCNLGNRNQRGNDPEKYYFGNIGSDGEKDPIRPGTNGRMDWTASTEDVTNWETERYAENCPKQKETKRRHRWWRWRREMQEEIVDLPSVKTLGTLGKNLGYSWISW